MMGANKSLTLLNRKTQTLTGNHLIGLTVSRLSDHIRLEAQRQYFRLVTQKANQGATCFSEQSSLHSMTNLPAPL